MQIEMQLGTQTQTQREKYKYVLADQSTEGARREKNVGEKLRCDTIHPSPLSLGIV